VEDSDRGHAAAHQVGSRDGEKLKVYRDDKHQHQAQKPQPLDLSKK